MSDAEFVRSRTIELTLAGGQRVRLRPVVPDDKERLVQGLERLSPASRYRRFMTAVVRIPQRQLAYFTELDYVNHYAIGVESLDEPGEPGIAIGRYVRLTDRHDAAEVAVTVIDDYHRLGLGTLLIQALAAVAVENGIRTFHAEFLGDNHGARSLIRRFDGRLARTGNPCLYTIDLEPQLAALRGTELGDRLLTLAPGSGGRGENNFDAEAAADLS